MSTLAALLSQPPQWFPLVILVVVLLLCVVVGVTLWWLLRRRAAEEEDSAARIPPPEPGEEPEERWFVARMRGQLRGTLVALSDLTGETGTPYSVPWVVVAGIEGADAWAMIEGVEAAADRTTAIPRAGTVRFCRHGALFHAGDDLVAHPGGLRRWRRLLGLMRLARIHRPLDGLVVAIPATMLDGPGALPFDRLADKAGQIYDLIATAQRQSGLRVPVTVVVTRCDSLHGFDALTMALPHDLRDEALGWAMPYGLESAFRPEWADEAMDSIATGLSHVGVQALMAPQRPADPDGLMLLPSRVRALAPRLRVLLAGMFQPSAYHQPFMFRGLYLTGALPVGGMAFANGLFDGKVFREHQLVRPLRGLVTARTRRVRLAQGGLAAVLAVQALALAWLSFDTPRDVANLMPLMATIEGDLRQLARGGEGAGPAFVHGASVRLLQEMVRVRVESLSSPAAPTSYLSEPDQLVEQAIAVGYDTLIMREMRRRLKARLADMANGEAQGLRGDGDAARQLARAVGRMVEFDDAYRTYLELPKARSAGPLASLVRYTLDIELPTGFQNNSDLYQRALRFSNVRPIDDVAVQMEKALRDLFAAAYRARFDERALRRRLERIAHLSSDGGEERNPEAAMARLQDLQKEFRAIGRDLDSASLGWINGTGSELGAAFDEALAGVDRISAAPRGMAPGLRDMGEKRLAEARQQLFSLLAAQSVPLLHLEDGKAVLAPPMVTLRKQVDDLLARPFMSEPLPAAPPLPTGARPVLWDGQWLKVAQKLLDDYLSYGMGEAMRLPPDMVFSVELAAFDQVNQRVASALSLAARSGDRGAGGVYQVEMELRALAGVSQQLAGIGDQMRRAKMDSLAVLLDSLVQAQATRLLAEVDAQAAGLLLVDRVPPFDWWDGTPPLAARTFRAATAADLTAMMEANREALSQITRDTAGPLVRILSSLTPDGRGRELVAKWQGIIRALTRYEQKSPDSSLRRLEQFVLVDMDQIDPARCDTLAGPPTPGGDLFARQLDELKAGIARRCGELGGERIRRRYARLHDLFNDTLAGRFPFAADPRPTVPRADPAQVRAFFQALSQEKPPARAALEAAAGPRAALFLDGVAEARKALAPMLVDPTLDQPLSYEVEADFRANAARDQGGNQIIEWVLDFGPDQRLSSLEPKRRVVWSSGQPARLSMRFARNAPAMPAPDPRGRYRVDGMTATWEAADPWALLSLVAQLTPDAGRLAELPDRRPNVLRVLVDTQRNPDAASGPRPVQPMVEAFLRLNLIALVRVPGKAEDKQPVVLPLFPVAAPDADVNAEPVPLWRE